MFPKDDAARRAHVVPSGQEELWEYLSYMLWYLHSGEMDSPLASEDSFIKLANDTLFKKDCNGTR